MSIATDTLPGWRGPLARRIESLRAQALLIALILVNAVILSLFEEHFPQWFGTLGESAYTLFQIMTLEGWADIARSVMEVYPLAWLFFVAFILVSTFTMLNLFIAVVVTSMQTEHTREIETERADAPPPETDLQRELAALRTEMRALRGLLEQRASETHQPGRDRRENSGQVEIGATR